nr:glycosyltransferase family 4 protein [Brachybacterium halotolerans]
MLEHAGVGTRMQARRLRSELELLAPGHRLAPLQAGAELGRKGPSTEENPDADAGLRVLHLITNSLPHTQSGYSLRTHRLLSSLRRAGVQSIALTRTGYPIMVGVPLASDEDAVDGVVYRRTLPSSLGATAEQRLVQEVDAALRIVDEFRPHVLHATTDYRNALVAQAVSQATGIPWILEVRGLMEQTWIASHRSKSSRARAADSEKARLVAAKEAELANEAHAVVTLSRTMAQELARRGVDDSRVVVVPNGVEDALLSRPTDMTDARRQVLPDLPSKAYAVGAVSALVDYEGFDVLLRAAARIIHDPSSPKELRNDLHVVIAGDGTAAPALRALTHELGIGDRTTMPGRVPRADAPTWLLSLDAVVVPRRDLRVTQWVTPQKPVEALALGRPLVVSDLPALRESVRTEEGLDCALLVPPEDPEALAGEIIRLWSHRHGSDGRSQAGRKLAASRRWPTLADRYVTVYRRLAHETAEE